MADFTQHRMVVARVFGMVELDNGDHGLASAQTPARHPTFWDVMVEISEELGDPDEKILLLEIENIDSEDKLVEVTQRLEGLFPDIILDKD